MEQINGFAGGETMLVGCRWWASKKKTWNRPGGNFVEEFQMKWPAFCGFRFCQTIKWDFSRWILIYILNYLFAHFGGWEWIFDQICSVKLSLKIELVSKFCIKTARADRTNMEIRGDLIISNDWFRINESNLFSIEGLTETRTADSRENPKFSVQIKIHRKSNKVEILRPESRRVIRKLFHFHCCGILINF